MSDDERLHHLFGRIPEAKVHLYGKAEPRPGRKMGHFTVTAPTVDQAYALAQACKAQLQGDGGPAHQ